MKIQKISIKNFRGYKDEINVELDNLTAFVGKNDIGKSSVLEALDVFFNDNKGVIKLDKDDINVDSKRNQNNDICITVCFSELPSEIIIDSTNKTSLKNEYLLNQDEKLEIIKRYPNAGGAKTYIKALHPTNSNCNNLLQKKDSELRKIIEENSILCTNKSINAEMRSAIWKHYEQDLNLQLTEIDITKGDTKSIWEKLQKYLPLYSLFQSDRKNSDGDSEVQDPLKEAVKEILKDETLQNTLTEVASTVEKKLKEVSKRTLKKLQEMNPEIANSLNPIIPAANSLKWSDVFKNVSIAGDENIPINKRGSGSKRLILLNFFRAEVERRQEEINAPSVIYAIEEPETSQHTENQKKLTRALLSLAETNNSQVIITTHSANIVKVLGFENIRLVQTKDNHKIICKLVKNLMPYPSLNEVNYSAFSEVSEEYHNELFGYIEEQGWLEDFLKGKSTVQYQRKCNSGITKNELIPMTKYIRHQIHHPENKLNNPFTEEQLKQSIEDMRDFINSKIQLFS